MPKYCFVPSLTSTEPLDPARLYLSVYPSPEEAYRLRNHPAPVGQVTRPGSTSMWAGVRLINGYSPIRAAGVGPAWTFIPMARSIRASRITCSSVKPDREVCSRNSGSTDCCGSRHELGAAQLALAWRLAHVETEGRVYERVGAPIGPLHAIDLPNEKSQPVIIPLVSDGRQKVVAEVALGAGAGSAALVFARPFFDGYCATLDGHKIAVESYRGFAPLIRLPAAAQGRLTLVYRPWWLVAGGARWF